MLETVVDISSRQARLESRADSIEQHVQHIQVGTSVCLSVRHCCRLSVCLSVCLSVSVSINALIQTVRVTTHLCLQGAAEKQPTTKTVISRIR